MFEFKSRKFPNFTRHSSRKKEKRKFCSVKHLSAFEGEEETFLHKLKMQIFMISKSVKRNLKNRTKSSIEESRSILFHTFEGFPNKFLDNFISSSPTNFHLNKFTKFFILQLSREHEIAIDSIIK